MKIKISIESGRVPITVMHVYGNIDSSTYQAFSDKADELIKGGAHYILVDLTNVSFLSSAGLRSLHGIFTQLRALYPDTNLSKEEVMKSIAAGAYKSPHLKLLNLSKEAQTAFTLSGFDMYIETYTDKEKAIASFYSDI